MTTENESLSRAFLEEKLQILRKKTTKMNYNKCLSFFL